MIIMIIAIVISTFTISAESISIDEAHFPDAVFREYVSEHFDDDHDGHLSQDEINKIKEIEGLPSEVSDLNGIGCFTHLGSLSVSNTVMK